MGSRLEARHIGVREGIGLAGSGLVRIVNLTNRVVGYTGSRPRLVELPRVHGLSSKWGKRMVIMSRCAGIAHTIWV